jgi:hypothetical protein
MAEERDSSRFEVQHMGTDRKTAEEGVDNITLLEEQLNFL